MSRSRQLQIIDAIGAAVMLYLLGLLATVWFVAAAIGAGIRKLLRRDR